MQHGEPGAAVDIRLLMAWGGGGVAYSVLPKAALARPNLSRHEVRDLTTLDLRLKSGGGRPQNQWNWVTYFHGGPVSDGGGHGGEVRFIWGREQETDGKTKLRLWPEPSMATPVGATPLLKASICSPRIPSWNAPGGGTLGLGLSGSYNGDPQCHAPLGEFVLMMDLAGENYGWWWFIMLFMCQCGGHWWLV